MGVSVAVLSILSFMLRSADAQSDTCMIGGWDKNVQCHDVCKCVNDRGGIVDITMYCDEKEGGRWRSEEVWGQRKRTTLRCSTVYSTLASSSRPGTNYNCPRRIFRKYACRRQRRQLT